MTIRVMRWVDRYFGIPLCYLTIPIVRLRRVRSRKRQLPDARRILVMKFFGLGSIFYAAPALVSLRKTHPEASIHFLTFESNRPFLELLQCVDSILTIRTSSPVRFVLDTVSFIRGVVSHPYEVVFDFEFFSKFSTFLCAISGSRRRVGFALPVRWRTALLTDEVTIRKDRHVSEAFASQIRLFSDLPVSDEQIRLQPTAQARAMVDALLNERDKRILVVNVNAGPTFIERRWPAERFSQLTTTLAADGAIDIVFTGEASEREYVESVLAKIPNSSRCVNLAGRLTVDELLAVLERAELVVSNDTGPLHLAAGVGTPVVGLFGPESPLFYGPRGAKSALVYKKIACSPCMNVYSAKTFRCPYDAECMRRIEVEDVEIAIADLMKVHA